MDSVAVRAVVDACHLAGAGAGNRAGNPGPEAHPLLGHPGILVTPHRAYLSDFTEAEYVRQQAQNVAALLRTGQPAAPVTELN